MDYKKCYYNLISSRQLLDRVKGGGIYYESHHILPKSLGGDNNKENLVLLTFKEHFIAHLLLSKMYDGEIKRKMCYALWRMSKGSSKHERIVSASQYKICREAEREAKKNHVVSEQTRLKISLGNKGKKRTPEMIEAHRNRIIGTTHTTSEETKEKIRNSNLGQKRSPECVENNRKARLGKRQSEESKQKRSKKLINIPRPQEVIDKIRMNNPLKREVICSNGEIYESINDAAIKLNLNRSNISAVCNGRREKTNGLIFKFNDETNK